MMFLKICFFEAQYWTVAIAWNYAPIFRDGKLKMFDFQKLDDSIDSDDTLNKCVVDLNLVQRAYF